MQLEFVGADSSSSPLFRVATSWQGKMLCHWISATLSNLLQGRRLETKAPCNVCFDLNIRRPDPDRWPDSDDEQDLHTEFPGRDHPEPEYDEFGFVVVRIDSLNAAADAGCLSCELLRKAWGHISHDAGDMLGVSEFSIRAFTDFRTGQTEFQVVLPQERTWVIQSKPGTPLRTQKQSFWRSDCELRTDTLE